jgi:PKD repeat protein
MKTKEAILVSLMAGALASCNHENATGPTKVSSPPTGSFVTSPSGMVLVGATVVTLTATGSDPSGSALTYTWDFGDGQSGVTGQTVTHVYGKPGTFTAVLTVRNAAGASATANGTVTARDLSGRWRDVDPAWEFDLTQSGSTISGTIARAGVGIVSQIRDGAVADPRSVKFFRDSSVSPRWYSGYTGNYSGSVDNTGNRLHLTSLEDNRFSYDLTRE